MNFPQRPPTKKLFNKEPTSLVSILSPAGPTVPERASLEFLTRTVQLFDDERIYIKDNALHRRNPNIDLSEFWEFNRTREV
jgi:hypothetical protein